MKDENRIVVDSNRFSAVQVIDENGVNLGSMRTMDAINIAKDKKLDLVEMSGGREGVVVCKIMNYSRHRFEQKKKISQAKKNQKNRDVKIIKMRPVIADNDLYRKIRQVQSIVESGNKVDVQISFRFNECRGELGDRLLSRLMPATEEFAKVEKKLCKKGDRRWSIVFVPK